MTAHFFKASKAASLILGKASIFFYRAALSRSDPHRNNLLLMNRLTNSVILIREFNYICKNLFTFAIECNTIIAGCPWHSQVRLQSREEDWLYRCVHWGEGTLGVNVEFFLPTFTSALLLWSGDHKVLFSVIADICCKFRAELCASKADRTEYGVRQDTRWNNVLFLHCFKLACLSFINYLHCLLIC